VHDPVTDGLDRARGGLTYPVEGGGELAVGKVVDGTEILAGQERVALIEQPEFEAARPGVDYEDVHAQCGQVQSVIAGSSSPCSRVWARARRRRSAICCRTSAASAPRLGTRSITSLTR